MYKVPMHVLKGILASLEQSNKMLQKNLNNDNSFEVLSAIRDNEKQINLIKLNFGLNG
jgi:hypothetical protein